MRNITAFAVLVIIALIPRPLQAQEQGYAFSLTPQFGIVFGQAEEIVYPGDTKAAFLSQLLWDMQPVLYYGLLMDFSRLDQQERWGFFSTLSLKNGIPGKTGYMEDRDWLSKENTDLTHYSKHDNHTRELFLLDFSPGLSFPFSRVLLFKTFINVSYMRFSFSGHHGYGEYNWPGYPPYVDYSGQKVISYIQEWLTASPGISLGCFFLGRFFAELSFMASPLIVCADLDEHKSVDVKEGSTTSQQFRDYMRGGILFEPGFRLSYTINKWLAATWDFSWRYINGTRGDTYKRSPIGRGGYVLVGEAGAGLSVINSSLGLKVRL